MSLHTGDPTAIEFRTAVDRFFGRPPDAVRPVVGKHLKTTHPNSRETTIDPEGRLLTTSLGLAGDDPRKLHNHVFRAVGHQMKRAQIPFRTEPTNLFQQSIAINHDLNDLTDNLKRGMIPDLLAHPEESAHGPTNHLLSQFVEEVFFR